MKLSWKPEIKATKLMTLLSEKDEGTNFTWEKRAANCKAIEMATGDKLVAQQLIEVSFIIILSIDISAYNVLHNYRMT